jgi:hypothetical protein
VSFALALVAFTLGGSFAFGCSLAFIAVEALVAFAFGCPFSSSFALEAAEAVAAFAL